MDCQRGFTMGSVPVTCQGWDLNVYGKVKSEQFAHLSYQSEVGILPPAGGIHPGLHCR